MGVEIEGLSEQEKMQITEEAARKIAQREKSTYSEGPLAWREFQPVHTENLNRQEAVIHFGGWGQASWQSDIEDLCTELANASGATTYALDTQEDSYPFWASQQAVVTKGFINAKQLKEVTISAYSLGIVPALELAKRLERENNVHVKGIILMDATLNNESPAAIATHFAQEGMAKPQYPKDMSVEEIAAMEVLKDWGMEELRIELKRKEELAGGKISLLKRTMEELKEVATIEENAKEVKAPIVLINGARDRVSRPESIIPRDTRKDDEPGYLLGAQREEYLKHRYFPNSSYVRMIVAEKLGNHSLPSNRPEDVARAGIFLINRSYRGEQQTDTQAAA